MRKPRSNHTARKSLRFESLEDRSMLSAVSISDATVMEGDTSPRFFDVFIDTPNGGGLSNPHQNVLGPDGTLYVTSGDTDSVLRYNAATGAFLGDAVPSGWSGLDYPWGMTFGPDNKLYVAGRRSDNILRYDPATHQIETFVADGNGLRGPVGLAFGPDGQLYVANSGLGEGRPPGPAQVLRFAGPTGGPNGEQPGTSLGVFVATGSGENSLVNPNHLVFHRDYLYVANTNRHSVNRYNASTGAFVDVFIPPNSGGLSVPNYLFFHTDGLLYVASQLSKQVLRYNSATGAFVDVFADQSVAGAPSGMAVDPHGLFYVSYGADGHQVLRYGPRSIAAFTVSLSAPSQVPVSVDFVTANGGAVVGSDFAATNGSLMFAPGQTSRTVLVQTLDDSATESNETFVVNLSNPVGAVIADGQGAGTIIDNDVPPTISISDATATEGDKSYQFADDFVPSGFGGLDGPEGLVFGPDGNLYVNSAFTNSVLRYDGVSGAYLGEFVPSGSGGLFEPRSLAFGPDGHLYVAADGPVLAVLKYDGSTGTFLGQFASVGTGNAEPRGITFGPDGNLYVSIGPENRIARFNGSNGSPLGDFVTAGSGGLVAPHGLVFGPDNHLYVASSNTNQVLRYDGVNGTFLGAFVVAGSGGLQVPTGVAFGSDGNLYVAGRDSDAIHRYNGSSGAFIDLITSPELDAPRYFTFGPDANIYIGTRFNNEVLRYHPESVFTVSLSSPSSVPINVDFATANGTAVVGSDYAATSGKITFAPGQTAIAIHVQKLDDSASESDETFFVNLSNPINGVIADGQGVGTIIDNDDLTKFYVVNDATQNRTYEYDAAGAAGDSYNLASGNSAPRGAASTTAGDRVWVVDANRNVYVYDTGGGIVGSWTARTLPSNATIEGIATNGTDVWIVDGRGDRVYRYAGAASRNSGSQHAASSFRLDSGNSTAKDIVTDGQHLWVVNDASTDRVFKYMIAGALVGSWSIDSANRSPTGITLDPANPQHIWIVDSGTDRVYQYTGAANRTSGTQAAATSFALAADNTNPQGIADPPSDLEVATAAPLTETFAFPNAGASRRFTPERRASYSAIITSRPPEHHNLLLSAVVSALADERQRSSWQSPSHSDGDAAMDAAWAEFSRNDWPGMLAEVAMTI